MPNPSATLIIPVENQVRELDAKLLLACIAAERGFPVVLGSRAFVHYRVDSIPRGVYLAKSMRSLSERMFGILRDLGHHIVAWDEESLVRPPDEYFYRRRLSARTIKMASALFAWGPDDARVFRDFPGYPGTPIAITGNPRADMMREEIRPYFRADVERIRQRHGRFVLVNTNFGHVNHFVPALQPKPGSTGAKDGFRAGLAEHRAVIFEHFQKMLPALSDALPDHTILVRPHPTERHDTWIEAAAFHGNVRVVNEGNVIPWLMACDVLIQNSCTTAVEAAILDTPAITYEPVASERFDVALTRDLTHRAASLPELVDLTRSITQGKLGVFEFPNRRERIAHHIAALDGPLACERILDALECRGYADQAPPSTGVMRLAKGRILNRLRTVEKKINERRPGHRNHGDYHAHRFPEIAVQELERRIGRLGQLLGRFDGIRVEQRSRHLFSIAR